MQRIPLICQVLNCTFLDIVYLLPKFIFRIKMNESTLSLKNLRSDSDTGPAEHCVGGSILISWYSWKSKNCTVNPLINKWGQSIQKWTM